MMATFPTIYRHGTLEHLPVVGELTNTMASDPVIRSQSDGGYSNTRAGFTRIPRKWHVKYEWMSKTNKNTIKDFEDGHYAGAESFTWYDSSDDDAVHTVRFAGLIQYTPHAHTNFLWWMLEFDIEEV